jgi:predicted acylesterase/phospholipase RssA
LHDVSVLLFDTGMRPEECHCLRWENITWEGGRNGVLLIAKGKTKAARRVLPLNPRVLIVLENRWKAAGGPGEGWVWPAETKDGHINHDSLKLQHKKALKPAKVRSFEVCSTDRITQFCERVLKTKTFEELKIPFAISATNIRTGEAVMFTKGSLVDPIRASCAYPGMFPPVEIDGRSYVDGMLAYSVPTTPLRHMGAERVLGVYLSAHWVQERGPRHMFEVIGQCFSIAQSKMSETWRKDADLVLETDVAGFAFDCFDRTPELIALGEASARTILPELKALLDLPGVDAIPEAIEIPTMPSTPVSPAQPHASPAA